MRVAAWLVRRRRWIALGWIVVLVSLAPLAGRVADRLDAGARVVGSQSEQVSKLLAGPLASAFARAAVLVIGGVAPPDAPEGRALLEDLTAVLRSHPDVAGTASFLDTDDSMFVGRGRTATFIIVGLHGRPADSTVAALQASASAMQSARTTTHPALTLRWTGESPLNVDMRATSRRDVSRAEARALPLTGVLLFIAFGSAVATALPILSAIVAITMALGIAAALGHAIPLSILLPGVVTMLGLGLGIDYALLIVSRFREARADGNDPVAAATIAAHHGGHTILLSAATVAIGFVALLATPLTEIRTIAVGGLLAVGCSSLLAVTLLPGLLATLGDRLEWGRVRRSPAGMRSGDQWRWLAGVVTAHPWRALALGACPLFVLASQSARLRTGLPRGDWLPPHAESAIALRDLSAMSSGSVVQTLRIVAELPEGRSVRRTDGWNILSRVSDDLMADPRVRRVRSITTVARAAGMGRSSLVFLPDSATAGLVSADGRFAAIEVIPHERVGPEEMTMLVRELRSRQRTEGDAHLLVGGLPAFNVDYGDASAGRFPQIVLAVVLGTLLALCVGTRSVLVPLKAAALNLLVVAAAFGAVTVVFQDGHGGGVFGVTEPLGAVFSTLPVIVFCVVYGLSMDYEVFLVSRVLEAKRRGMADRDAIIDAVGSTAQVITSAAGIMLAVFLTFSMGDLLFTKMLGFALATAVLLDATVVRLVVGPALLQLAGRWNWWPGHRP